MRNCWSRLLLRETQDAANNQVGVLTLIFIYSQTLMPGLPNLFLLMITVIFLFLLICLRGSCVAQATLELGMQLRITFHSSEYPASHSGITGMCWHAWGVQFCGWNPGLMHIRQVLCQLKLITSSVTVIKHLFILQNAHTFIHCILIISKPHSLTPAPSGTS